MTGVNVILVKAGILMYPKKENVNKQGIVNSEKMLVGDKKSAKMLPALSKKENQGLGSLYWSEVWGLRSSVLEEG